MIPSALTKLTSKTFEQVQRLAVEQSWPLETIREFEMAREWIGPGRS